MVSQLTALVKRTKLLWDLRGGFWRRKKTITASGTFSVFFFFVKTNYRMYDGWSRATVNTSRGAEQQHYPTRSGCCALALLAAFDFTYFIVLLLISLGPHFGT